MSSRLSENRGDPSRWSAWDLYLADLRSEDWVTRRAAVRGLGNLGDARALHPLCVSLTDPDPDVSEAAITALGALGDPGALEPLLARVGCAYNPTRRAVVRALGRVGDPRAVEALLVRLEDEDLEIRAGAAEALGRICDVRAISPLGARLADRSGDVRRAAVRALVQFGSAAVVPLCGFLSDRDALVRRNAVVALGKLCDPSTLAPLSALLADNDPGVRAVAATALVRLGPIAADVFRGCLQHPRDRVRRIAAQSLDALGWAPKSPQETAWLAIARGEWAAAIGLGCAAVQPFCAVLGDAERPVRAAAIHALAALGDRAALPALRSRLRRWGERETDRALREQVRTVVAQIDEATAGARDKPIPGVAPPPDVETLPIPGRSGRNRVESGGE